MHLKDQPVLNTIVFMFYFGKMLRCEAQRTQNMKKKWRLKKRIREIGQRTKRIDKTQACPQESRT